MGQWREEIRACVEEAPASYIFLRMGAAAQSVTGLSDSKAGGREVGQGHDVQPPIPASKWVLLQVSQPQLQCQKCACRHLWRGRMLQALWPEQ